MSTLPDSTAPQNSVPGASTASASEKYGGENLPVLIQLPDLSAPAECRLPVAQSIAAEANASFPATEPWDAPDLEEEPSTIRLADLEAEPQYEGAAQRDEGPPDAEPPRGMRLRQQRQQRRERATRRSERHAAVPVWLRGIGQLTLAVMLAGVLLSIIITVKNWNAHGEVEPKANDTLPIVEAPSLPFGPSHTSKTDDIAAQQKPGLGMPSLTGDEPTLESMFPANPAPKFDMPGRAAPASYGEPHAPIGSTPPAAGQTVASPQYPTTGIEPVASVPPGPAGQGYGPAGRGIAPAGRDFPAGPAARGWQESLPTGPVQSAERPAPPTSNQPYHQYR